MRGRTMEDMKMAHLDKKTRSKALCGRCGDQLAEIIENLCEGRRPTDEDNAYEDPDFFTGRILYFPAGWITDATGRTWELSNRAKKLIKQGRRPAYGRQTRQVLGLTGYRAVRQTVRVYTAPGSLPVSAI